MRHAVHRIVGQMVVRSLKGSACNMLSFYVSNANDLCRFIKLMLHLIYDSAIYDVYHILNVINMLQIID